MNVILALTHVAQYCSANALGRLKITFTMLAKEETLKTIVVDVFADCKD